MKRKILLLLLCLLFLGIFLYSGFRIWDILREYRAGEETYAALTAYVNIPEPTQPPQTKATMELPEEEVPVQTEAPADEILWPTVDFADLQAINPDVVAWIYMEGTQINYPVVRGEDNDQYLYRMIDGSYNGAGSIFMDYRNASDFTDRHTILYGHHMNNNTMFGFVADYVEQDLSKEYPYCQILTPEGNYKLEFFAGYVDDPSADAWQLQFGSDEEYGRWLEWSAERSAFTNPLMPTPEDRVVTLSTCSYEFSDARCVLLGVLRPASAESLAE